MVKSTDEKMFKNTVWNIYKLSYNGAYFTRIPNLRRLKPNINRGFEGTISSSMAGRSIK